MAGQDALKVYWEHFFKAETGTYEKSTWLDLFLAEFLIRVNDGANPKELIKFCPISGVVSLVGCELLCGIHRVTSSVNAHCTPVPPVDPSCSGKEGQDNESPDAEPKPEDPRLQSSSALTRATAQSPSEILRQYLLRGVAWRCLLLLKALGVEGMSCCRQLSSVLVWVYGELPGTGGGADHAPTTGPASTKTPIYQLFSHKIWNKQKLSGSPGSKTNSPASSDRGSVAVRSRHVTQVKQDLDSKSKRTQEKSGVHSSDSGEPNTDLQILNKSLTIKVSTPDDVFEYFDSPVRTSNDYPNETLYGDPYYVPKKPKPKANDYMNDKHKEIINTEMSGFEFTLLIIDLLQDLCKTESSLSGSEGSQVSVQCINFSLRNLCSLQFGSLPQAVQYSNEEISTVKVALTELLIVSLDKVLVHSDLCTKLINNGILPMLLRILEDVVCKSRNKYNAKDDKCAIEEKPNKTESENLLKFVFGVAYCITAFFHCLLMQCRTIEKLRAFTDQFKLYGDCLKGGLLKECIELMIRIPADEDQIVLLIKKLIESLGKLILGMKRVRSEVVHSSACSKTRHKVCRQRVAAGMHHHHDILGEAGTGLPLAASCCISVLYGTLTSLLTDEEVSSQSMLRSKILRTMLSCGVCCCFSPGFLMESIVRLMLTHNNVATLCLQVLEHTVYGELGASVLIPKATDQLPCSICEPNDDKRDVVRKYCPHGVSPVERKSVWSFLIHYNSLLQLDNHNNVLHATVSHLLRVTPKCRMEMKYELLFSVIYPTFIVAKHRYIIRTEEAAYFLTASCLNIFATLLNTVPFAEQFVQKGGLSYVLELVSLSEFSNQCCSILEIAIIVEIFKLMKESSDMTYFREISSLSSVQMLFKSLSEMTDKCYKIYKLKLPEDKFGELRDVTKEREALMFQEQPRQEMQSRKMSIPRPVKTIFASSENIVEDSIENFLEVLKNVWTFWKSCAGLCLYSPMFRQYLVSESVFLDSYGMLKVLLFYLCHSECGMPEMRILIKIVEALLTAQFAVSDVTSGRSKETSCGLVRDALSDAGSLAEGGGGGLRALCEALIRVSVARPSRHHAMPTPRHAKGLMIEDRLLSDAGSLAEGGGGGLRALCEALIRVSVARPSRHHAMPTPQHAKVPPLGCQSGASSTSGSSSEDSTGGPYASEHSEPAQLDPGYEADVEIGKLELQSLEKSKKLSGMLALNSNTAYAAAEDMDMDPWAYSSQSELAHPELCIIVVDVLTQLINKLVTSKQDSPSASMQRATAALARACCSRLAGALAGSGAAPHALLPRLLPAAQQLLATSPHQPDLQRSILELIHVVASQSITSTELASILRLFTAEAPPLGALLTALQRLVNTAVPGTPDCILSFPVDTLHAEDTRSSLEEEYVIVSPSSQSRFAESFAMKLHEAHARAGVTSPWSVGAVRCGVEGASWAPWLQGFALLLWLRPAPAAPPAHTRAQDEEEHWYSADDGQNEPQEPDKKNTPKKESPPRSVELSHVVTIGTDVLTLELWMDTNTGSLTVRLTRPDPAVKLVSEACVPGALPTHRWACLALNVTERVYKRRIHIQVTVIVNGLEIETVSLPLQGILVRKVTPTMIVVGHASRGSVSGAYHLAQTLVYRAPVLTVYTALHLTAHGPDHCCQVRCEAPNYPLVLTPEILDSNIDWDQVYEISSNTLRELHDNLLLTFSANSPNIMNLYHQTVSLPTGLRSRRNLFAGRVASTAQLRGSAASGAGGAGGASVPEALFVTWTGAALASTHRGVAPAVYMLQGPDVMLYLFARVVELEGSAEEQAQALSIVLRVCRADNRLYSILYEGPALQMLHTVFASTKCVFSYHMLKVILDEACNNSILMVIGNSLIVSARSDAVAIEPRLLLLLMRAWRQLHTPQELTWEVEDSSGVRTQERGSLWALTLCCLRALVLDSHPRRTFNQYQLNRVRLLRALLAACKERFLNSDCGPLEAAASNSLVQLVRGLLGAPVQLDRLVLLADFLLLMHQASDTFVTHSRANFYFLLSSETRESGDFHLAFRRRTSRRARVPSDVTPSSSSVTSDDVTADAAARERLDHSSLESTKHMKGIINMQIKEGRKHNISSTSENSDITLERSTSIEHKGEEAQSDNEDEVEKLTANTMEKVAGELSDLEEGHEKEGQEREEQDRNGQLDEGQGRGEQDKNGQLDEGQGRGEQGKDELVDEGLGKEELGLKEGQSKEELGRDRKVEEVQGKEELDLIEGQERKGRGENDGQGKNDLGLKEGHDKEQQEREGYIEEGQGKEEQGLKEGQGKDGYGVGVSMRSGKNVLKEYIVVDVDEVNNSTVDMYASELYQQKTVKAGAESGWSACEGLLLLLRDTIAALPDHAISQAVAGAIQSEVLIVLGNHRSALVRAALIRAMSALARRAPAELSKKLRQHNYYVHLANQVSLYPPSWELAAACAALLTKCDVPLEDQLDDDIWLDITEDAVLRSPPLLALLPGCLEDVPLAHNITLIIRRLIEKASLKTLTEVSVAEVVVKAIRGIGQRDSEFEGRDLLLEDLFELLNRLAVKASNSQHSMQTILELHHMLTYVEWAGAARGQPAMVRVARDAQHSLFMSQLDHLEDRLHTSYTAHTKYVNYFTTVLSSAVSLGAEAGGRAERAELAARHLGTVVRAVNFLLTRSPKLSAVPEAPLVERLFATLLPAVSGAAPTRPKWWVGGGADWVSPLQELFCWAAAPAPGVQPLQANLLRALYRAPPAALHLLSPSDPPAMRKLAVYLLSMLKNIHAEAEVGTPPVELAITDWARGWAVGTQAGLAERVPSETLAVEAERLLEVDEQRWAKIVAKMRTPVAKVVFSKDGLASKLTESAMFVTRQVVDIQNGERKAFMEQLRRAHSDAVACTQRWARLVDSCTHDQAVWHDPHCYPGSWELDATEGAGRVRVRLRRAHLDVHPKFLKETHRAKLDNIQRGPPLRSVIGAGAGLRGGLVARLQLNETVSYMTRVTCVTVSSETPGELLLSDRCIHFVPEDSLEESTPPDARRGRRPAQHSGAQSWPLEAVAQVATRRWCLQERAVELFLSSGHAHLLAFEDINERTAFLKALGNCHLPGRIEPDTLTEAMAQWRNGSITNWEYLMRLNGLAGRTYNDLMQYPVLPFVLADYSSRILRLDQPDAFRDLRKPMAVQNPKREQHYINTYNDLKAARREGCSSLIRQQQPHHYASLYSNSGGVLHYLVRLPPFTQLFLNYQDNNFDMPDRTFHSLATTWRLITNDSPTDVKELIPELFYLPELFHNNEGLNLGIRQCGAGVDDVELPPWAPDSRLFTLVHRQALEAPHVTENLPHWIDLVFGYKQTGQAAIDAINVFPACTYYGFDPSALEDEMDRTAAATMVRTYGQAPRQLLRTAHPHRPPDLLPAKPSQVAVWAGVEGASWGSYCGSPALGPPTVVSRRACPAAYCLQALPHPRAATAAPSNTQLQPLTGESLATTPSGAFVGAVALVSWGHSDNIVRVKRRRDARPDLLLHVPALDQITRVATSCISAGCPCPVFFGHVSGRVISVTLRLDAHAPLGSTLRPHMRTLIAHTAPVTDINVCARAGLLATASADGKIVLWDLHDLSYIRTLPNREMLPVSLVTISATLCDVASVHEPPSARAPRPAPGDACAEEGDDSDSYEKDSTYKYESLLRVHTVNARFVGSVKVADRVTSICYSAAPEGVSVNCIACGLSTGSVRLYSSWDLRHMLTIPPAHKSLPLLSLTYSSDSSILFGCYEDGMAVAWESGAQGKPAPVRILPVHALF